MRRRADSVFSPPCAHAREDGALVPPAHALPPTLLLLVSLAACGAPGPMHAPRAPAQGGSSQPSSATEGSATMGDGPSEERAQPRQFAAPPGVGPSTTTAPSSPQPSPQPSTRLPAGEATTPPMAELIGIETELASMLGAPDCANACRALRSMGRAAARVCDATPPPPPPPPPPQSPPSAGPARDPDCVSAEGKLARARHDVTAACGACPDAPDAR